MARLNGTLRQHTIECQVRRSHYATVVLTEVYCRSLKVLQELTGKRSSERRSLPSRRLQGGTHPLIGQQIEQKGRPATDSDAPEYCHYQ